MNKAETYERLLGLITYHGPEKIMKALAPWIADQFIAQNLSDEQELARDLCELQDSLGCNCEQSNNQEKAMNRLRDLIASEGELGDLKPLTRKALRQVPNTLGNHQLFEELKRLGITQESP